MPSLPFGKGGFREATKKLGKREDFLPLRSLQASPARPARKRPPRTAVLDLLTN
jgi:hypothetical protein